MPISLGLRYSKDELDKLKDLYLADFEAWNKRQLPNEVIGIFIDAYVSEVKDNDKVTLLKSSPTHEQAVDDFKKLLSEYKDKYPLFVKYTIARAEYYFNFTHLPLDVRKSFYTTNAVESFNSTYNSLFEKKRNLAGGGLPIYGVLESQCLFTLPEIKI